MKRFMPFMFVPFIALAACGDDATTTPDGTVPDATRADGDAAAETVVTPGTSALTGVNTNVQVTTPTRNANCDNSEVLGASNGIVYPWGGLTVAGKDYTCNKCPSGLPDFQGMWRYHGFKADKETPDYTEGGDADTTDSELLFIDGNTWYSRFSDIQSGQVVETRGWLLCTQQPEHPNEHLFWVKTAATPAGPDDQPGDINETDVILSSGTDKKLIAWYDEVGGSTSVQVGYCKIGTTSNGQTCNNPMD